MIETIFIPPKWCQVNSVMVSSHFPDEFTSFLVFYFYIRHLNDSGIVLKSFTILSLPYALPGLVDNFYHTRLCLIVERISVKIAYRYPVAETQSWIEFWNSVISLEKVWKFQKKIFARICNKKVFKIKKARIKVMQ